MGLSRLYLVNPREFPSDKARWRAASAEELVDGATVVATLDEAIGDCQLVIGTSARDRRIPWPVVEPDECAGKVIEAVAGGMKAAIIFGRESRGLKNEELQRCNYHVTIPTGPAYASLNLAMAVQVVCYELLKAARDGAVEREWDVDHATAREVEHFFEHLERTLVGLDFHDPDNPRQLMTRLRRLFNRVRLDRMEVSILRGILTSIEQKATGKKEGDPPSSGV